MKKSEIRKEFASNFITSVLLGVITFIISFVFVYLTGVCLKVQVRIYECSDSLNIRKHHNNIACNSYWAC